MPTLARAREPCGALITSRAGHRVISSRKTTVNFLRENLVRRRRRARVRAFDRRGVGRSTRVRAPAGAPIRRAAVEFLKDRHMYPTRDTSNREMVIRF